MNRPTRSILFLLPFVAVAAAINCAVALACTLWSPDRAPHDADHQTLAADMGLPPHWDGMMFPTAMDSVGLHVYRATWVIYNVAGNDAVLSRPDLSSNYEDGASIVLTDVTTVKAGFPLPCTAQCSAALPLRWSYKFDQTSLLYSVGKHSSGTPSYIEQAPTHTTDMLSTFGLHAIPGRTIPLTPLWRPFALNTLFYAALLVALFRGIPLFRRAIRLRRSQCLACGYALNNLPTCPECGTTSHAKTMPAALGREVTHSARPPSGPIPSASSAPSALKTPAPKSPHLQSPQPSIPRAQESQFET